MQKLKESQSELENILIITNYQIPDIPKTTNHLILLKKISGPVVARENYWLYEIDRPKVKKLSL